MSTRVFFPVLDVNNVYQSVQLPVLLFHPILDVNNVYQSVQLPVLLFHPVLDSINVYQSVQLPVLLFHPVLDGVEVCQQCVQLTEVALQANARHTNLKRNINDTWDWGVIDHWPKN